MIILDLPGEFDLNSRGRTDLRRADHPRVFLPRGDFLKTVEYRLSSVDNSRRDVCNRGRDSFIVPTERVPMPTIPQRIASAFAVFCGRYGDVTKMAQEREQSRQALYREAQQVADAVDG